ncbi:MAG: MBL fold metallo-hydrolase, partial [Chlamydiia bacterium]|nr:MBL fold metallo-hydrolase [Chlamydiia bacterium]
MSKKKISGECLILGCGNSTGVPVLGCSCEVCHSEDPRNHRSRPSVLIRCGKTSLLIDAGPDIREQLLRESITEIHGVFITHSHYDHTGGLDDLRILALFQQQAIPMWVGEETYIDLEKRMDYLIHSNITVGVPFKRFSIEKFVGDCGECRFDGFSWRYFLYTHSGVPVYGMRIGDFAYVTDIREYPESIFEELRGVRTLV